VAIGRGGQCRVHRCTVAQIRNNAASRGEMRVPGGGFGPSLFNGANGITFVVSTCSVPRTSPSQSTSVVERSHPRALRASVPFS
jgi:hypothetical protein